MEVLIGMTTYVLRVFFLTPNNSESWVLSTANSLNPHPHCRLKCHAWAHGKGGNYPPHFGKITPIQNYSWQKWSWYLTEMAVLTHPLFFRRKTCNNRPRRVSNASLSNRRPRAEQRLWRAHAPASMPHEVMNASRQTHNESDIPEIRVKTAYNGQVTYIHQLQWFGKLEMVCSFLFNLRLEKKPRISLERLGISLLR